MHTISPFSLPIDSERVNPVPTQPPHSIVSVELSAPAFTNLISNVEAELAASVYVADGNV